MTTKYIIYFDTLWGGFVQEKQSQFKSEDADLRFFLRMKSFLSSLALLYKIQFLYILYCHGIKHAFLLSIFKYLNEKITEKIFMYIYVNIYILHINMLYLLEKKTMKKLWTQSIRCNKINTRNLCQNSDTEQNFFYPASYTLLLFCQPTWNTQNVHKKSQILV